MARIVDFETFASEMGAGRYTIDHGLIGPGGANMSKRARRATEKRIQEEMAANALARDSARVAYIKALDAGEIEAPSSWERARIERGL